MFGDLPRGEARVILADPPWKFEHWGKTTVCGRDPERYYDLMTAPELFAMPVSDLCADDCVLFLWATWPLMPFALRVISAWGFTYKTCAFDWMKADVSTIDLFPDPKTADMKLGYWTRSNSEPCLLATRGNPKRKDMGVRMGIIEKTREHSRKPDCVYDRIERLVEGPYVELFARTTRQGWRAWGRETEKFRAAV